ncbi:hypothetical protein MA16_Dca003639 [Dendrobium catenatum]|uniref:Uncharacterized protein n=1 Tax=Dendrobium catenatum TaxID=906689 RepID=A0A2I0WFJ5_9ASPA|nr:hypothetical protein MA16_Dca003639 [Dendrobium catenatum]
MMNREANNPRTFKIKTANKEIPNGVVGSHVNPMGNGQLCCRFSSSSPTSLSKVRELNIEK